MSYATFASQGGMAFDHHRNALYAAAIRQAVTEDSVVLDLGAGVGILGLIAAAAGARRVYLVEPEPIVKIAKQVAEANGLADSIVILEGKIEDVELPEQVDIIISVFTGNLLFSEDLLPSLFYARDRYLKPGGTLIPDRAELIVTPVEARDIHDNHIGIWSEPNQGIDFSPARAFAANEIIWLDRKNLEVNKLSTGDPLVSLDLMVADNGDCLGETRLIVTQGGLCHGLLCSIRIKLLDQWLSTDPDDPDVHWSPVLLPLDPPMPVIEAAEINVSLQRPFRGDWTWSVRTGNAVRRHSTFLANLDGSNRLRKVALTTKSQLNNRGEQCLQALTLMKEGKTNGQIVSALADAADIAPGSNERVLSLVQTLALRYGE